MKAESVPVVVLDTISASFRTDPLSSLLMRPAPSQASGDLGPFPRPFVRPSPLPAVVLSPTVAGV